MNIKEMREKECTACSGSGYYCGGACGACEGTGLEYTREDIIESQEANYKNCIDEFMGMPGQLKLNGMEIIDVLHRYWKE